jgi:hypothetical protein
MRLRDELGVFYQDEDFASLYPQRGRPAQAPWRLAMILVMQYLENLSDRQASVAVQGRIDCTRAKTNPRGLTIQAQSDYEALQKARERQKTEQFQKQYALRSGIEGTISQGIRAFEMRDCRYIGLAKTHLQHILTAAAINLSRVFAWLEEIPRAKTRSSHFARLADSNVC